MFPFRKPPSQLWKVTHLVRKYKPKMHADETTRSPIHADVGTTGGRYLLSLLLLVSNCLDIMS